jgi:hypothetical protein
VLLAWNDARIDNLKSASVANILVRCEFQYPAQPAAAAARMHMVQLTGPHIPESDKAMIAMCTVLPLAPVKFFFVINLFILVYIFVSYNYFLHQPIKP